MIVGLDHIALTVGDVWAAAADFERVLGRKSMPSLPGQPSDLARLSFDNMALHLVPAAAMAGVAETASPARLVFAADDLDKAAHRLARRSLPGTLSQGASRILDLDVDVTHGVPISLAQFEGSARSGEHADIAGLDHVVIRSPDPERAVALYGGRLGLDLRLDRTHPATGSRMLFFVCGGLVVEIVHDAKKGRGDGSDRFGGLAWRARDIDRAHARMTTEGIDVSEVRDGRRPGSQVFTIKSHVFGVPTLVIGGEGLSRA